MAHKDEKIYFNDSGDVEKFTTVPERLFSATHQEIVGGATADVYFVKTKEILEAEGKADTVVTAEIFSSRAGIMAGTTECLYLLNGLPLEVWALEEGVPFDAKETVLRIKGPYSVFGIYETALLGILASSSAWATASKECKDAAMGIPFYSFGARHIHPAVSPVMERAAIIGGASGAACILGAKFLGMEPVGTIPHALVLIMGDTVKSALAYHTHMPPESPRVILVDTFRDEVEESLKVGKALGKNLSGVRLDTPSERGGVTPDLVREVRAKLNLVGLQHVSILVSGGMNPEKISVLGKAGANSFGVGSYISSARPIDMTMDLKEIDGRPVAKRGRIPGIQQNLRLIKYM